MAAFSWRSALESNKQILWNVLLIAVGSILCTVGINGILIPQQFLSGGITGVAITIHYLVPSLPIAMLYFILNIPIYALGWRFVGRRFFLYSIAGVLIFSLSLLWSPGSLPIHDKILSSLLAGIIIGLGSGIILRSLGSAGGLDILSIILLKGFSIRLGSSVLGFNALVLGVGAILFSLERSLCTLVYLYVNSNIINLVVTGLSQRKAVYIVSAQWEEISRAIQEKINRGVTLIGAKGGFTGQQIQMLYTVITFRELARLKKMINNIDPHAFVVVTDTLEVMGRQIGNQPHW